MRLVRSPLTAVLVAFALLAPAGLPTVAQAAVCPSIHYAEQVTGTSNMMNHDTCGVLTAGQVYEGWIGIDGQITTPTTTVKFVPGDYAAGWLGMESFSHPANGWAQSWIHIGWETGGTDGHCPAVTGYEMFVEWNSSESPGIICQPLGPPSLGSAVTYRIVFVNGCWSAYYDYNVPASVPLCGLPSSMAALAANELANGERGETDTTMPQSVFGSSDPNTNAALRLKGASGWVPWGTSLTAGGTIQQDDRVGCPPCYYISSYHEFYDELTFGR